GNVARRARQHALEASACKAAPADAADAAHAAVVRPDSARGGGRAVRRIIIDENDLPVAGRQKLRKPLDQERDIGFFIEGPNHDGQFRRGPHSDARVRPQALRGRAYGRDVVDRRLWQRRTPFSLTGLIALSRGPSY